MVLAQRAGHDRLLPQACRNLVAIAEKMGEGAQHLILERAGARHRVKIEFCPASGRSAFLVGADSKAAMRAAALRAFLASGDSTVRGAVPSIIEPTSWQRYRLALLLRILDHLEQAPPGATSLRVLASEIVYARELTERSIEWKSSSRRRQTQRLVALARHMAATGYRRLLNGRGARGEDAGSRQFVAGDEQDRGADSPA